MSIAAATEAAADRPLPLRMRGDLEFSPQWFGRRRYWAVKDPVSLTYFHLREEEYRLLTMLDGRASLAELRQRCEAALAPRRVSVEDVHGYLANLHRHALVLAESPGQGQQLLVRRGEARRRKLFETLAGLLTIRFRGVNPRPLLDWLYPKLCFVFAPWCVGLVLTLALAAAVLVAVEFHTVQARLPSFAAFVGASNLPWLVATLAAIKVLHELGHALACRRFGGDCHEIGLMLLVFTPALYCNVSDSWMLPSRWHRVAIAAAGMYVELMLATACTFLWWFSQPGLFNALCLNAVIVCSVGTLLFNGNPLLRYDGYFILSDLVEIPNLKAQSTAALKRLAARWCLGIELPEDRGAPRGRRGFVVAYGVASGVYRIVIVGVVLWVLAQVARPYHLETLVVGLAAVTIGGMLWPLADVLVRFARNPARPRIAPLRLAAVCAAAGLAGLAALLVPLPMTASAPVMLEYRDAQSLYASQPGKLVRFVPVGEKVNSGDVVAQLENADVELELARLSSQRDRQRLYLANLEKRRLQGDIAGGEIPAATAALADAEARLAQFAADAKRLSLVADRAGTVLPPPELPPETRADKTLRRWSGTPLVKRNLGAWLDTGTLVCLVGDSEKFEAILHVDQADVELVRPGQQVAIALDHRPGETFTGKVVEVAKLDLAVMPRALAAAGDLPARTDERGAARPLDTWYQARVALDEDPPRMLARVHGRAKISVAPQTLAARIARFLQQTFGR